MSERVTGLIYTLDLGISSGFARGKPGDVPASGTVKLKKTGEDMAVAFSNLIAFLADEFATHRPVCLVKEQVKPLEAFKQMGMSQAVVYAHAGYHAIVEGLCGRFGIPWQDLSEATARKHFIGKAHRGNRDDTKAAVVGRCHLLGLMPKDCDDDNRADALCIHDWACVNFGGRAASIHNFHLFGQGETNG